MKTSLLPDGRQLAYREAGEGPALVLLHGWAMSSAVFAEVLQQLAASFRVLAPDLPGHGHSPAAPVLDLESLTHDLRCWVDSLDLPLFSLAGWSLGGQAALALATAMPGRIHRLLLIAATPRFVTGKDWLAGLPEAEVRAMARGVKNDCRRTLERFFHLQFEEGEVSRERLLAIVRFALRDQPPTAAPAALAGLDILRRTDLRGILATVAAPTLILHGSGDRIVPTAAGRFLAGRIPEARYLEWSGVGHAPFLSRPAAFLELCGSYFPS